MNHVYLVVGLSPQSGKSTVAARISAHLGRPWVNSSSVVQTRVEERLGLPRGVIADARSSDHDAYRPELIAEADAMRAAGISPGLLCVDAGWHIIDGLRAASEVEQVRVRARELGLGPVVICVDRPGAQMHDNTEVDALRAGADVLIVNDRTVAQLEATVDEVLAAYGDQGAY